ncbi:Kunitz-type trypsin inhibitor KTI1 [Senna tora]|uniref:Kunitz-type trypsin inhibitor KTI1 n=1 Tax=Senna tora TaxID=362788 RepID=A0A834T0H3_9FABA|nr:Kunitz-type trypsin inhibitor KTI1 [Senna tora]
MKKITLLPLSLFLLAFFSTTTSAVVVDTDGNIMKNGGSYYILPVFRGMGGGLGLGQTGNETCPISVVQDPNELSHGMPVRIASPYLTTFINEGFPLSIGFITVPTCADTPSEWTVVKKMNELGFPVKITGYKNTLNGVFTIKRHEERDYKIQFCGYNSMMCGDIGIHVDDDGVRHVVVGHVNGPFLVNFKKQPQHSGESSRSRQPRRNGTSPRVFLPFSIDGVVCHLSSEKVRIKPPDSADQLWSSSEEELSQTIKRRRESATTSNADFVFESASPGMYKSNGNKYFGSLAGLWCTARSDSASLFLHGLEAHLQTPFNLKLHNGVFSCFTTAILSSRNGSVCPTVSAMQHHQQLQHSKRLEAKVADLEKEVQKQTELRIMYRKRIERTQDYLRNCLQVVREWNLGPRCPITLFEYWACNFAYWIILTMVRMIDDDIPLAQFTVAFEGASWADPDSISLMVMQAMLVSWNKTAGGGKHMGSELAQRVGINEVAESTMAFNNNYKDTGLFGVYAVAKLFL